MDSKIIKNRNGIRNTTSYTGVYMSKWGIHKDNWLIDQVLRSSAWKWMYHWQNKFRTIQYSYSKDEQIKCVHFISCMIKWRVKKELSYHDAAFSKSKQNHPHELTPGSSSIHKKANIILRILYILALIYK